MANVADKVRQIRQAIYGKDVSDIKIKDGDFGLANVASTVTDLFGIEKTPFKRIYSHTCPKS